MSDRLKVAVVVPTITGRELEFERCINSIKAAIKENSYGFEYEIITEKDTTREEIIRKTDFRKFDYVTFIDDDDFVTKTYFFRAGTLKYRKGIDILVQGRVSVRPSYYIESINSNTMIDGKSLFDVNSIRVNKSPVPTWYITGAMFKSSLIESFKQDILSKYDIKGCWEDLMYWAYFETLPTKPSVYGIRECEYVQVCLNSSLTRNNKQKEEQMDYNMSLVKEYLLKKGFTEGDIEECFNRINRCRTRKYGLYGDIYPNSGSITKSNDDAYLFTEKLLDKEMKKSKNLNIFPFSVNLTEYDGVGLYTEKVLKYLGCKEEDVIVLRIETEFNQMYAYNKILALPTFKRGELLVPGFRFADINNFDKNIRCLTPEYGLQEMVLYLSRKGLECFIKNIQDLLRDNKVSNAYIERYVEMFNDVRTCYL